MAKRRFTVAVSITVAVAFVGVVLGSRAATPTGDDLATDPNNPANRKALLHGYEAGLRTDNSGWNSNATAPRDGTVIEFKETFGVAPSYGLVAWKNPLGWVDATEAGRGHADEPSMLWRLYHGDVAHYVDPTNGEQDSAAYWRGATAALNHLPPDAYEALARRNAANR